MIAAVLEIGPRLGAVIVLTVAIVTIGGYMGAWRGERRRSSFPFPVDVPDDEGQATLTSVD
jgi:hypothetical protein